MEVGGDIYFFGISKGGFNQSFQKKIFVHKNSYMYTKGVRICTQRLQMRLQTSVVYKMFTVIYFLG